MLLMIQQVVNAEHRASKAFRLLRVKIAAGPAQVNDPAPSRFCLRYGLNGIVWMHQQEFHE
jgi:hypothetical protein